ncbi:MAG TPA: hypothetical protein PKD55_11510 [Bellilinea sp.]|nr:hypothetical protein [Bellilinea sp.]
MSPRKQEEKVTSNWAQLYEARRATKTPQMRPVGRPPSIIPRKKVGLTLSKGEEAELEVWQQRFSAILGRKVSAGETVGILTRVLSARFDQLGEVDVTEIDDLEEFVNKLVRGER